MFSNRKIEICIFVLSLIISQGNSASCGNCDNCQVITPKNQCLKCKNGYQVNIFGFCALSQDLNPILSQRSVEKYLDNVGSIQGFSFQIPKDSNCWFFEQDICKKCYYNFIWKLETNRCEYVGDWCRYYNQKGCVTCFDGFQIDLKTSKCVRIPNYDPSDITNRRDPVPRDYNPIVCIRYQNNGCKQCAHRYVLLNSHCKRVHDACQSWNDQGICLSCFTGFTINNQFECKLNLEHFEGLQKATKISEVEIQPKTIYYPTASTQSSKIQGGSQNLKQKPVHPQFSHIFSSKPFLKSDLPTNCAVIDSGGTCIKCAYRYYNSSITGRCQAVSELCQSWSMQTGFCTACYKGYVLLGKNCMKDSRENLRIIAHISPSTSNCLQLVQGVCRRCAFKYYLSQGQCFAVTKLCKKWNSQNGGCTECFTGYSIKNGECIRDQTQRINSSVIPGCAQVDAKGNCNKCAIRFFFKNGQCRAVNDKCKIWNEQSGLCTQCSPGYYLFDGDCVQTNIEKFLAKIQTVANCRQVDLNGLCIQCIQRFFNYNGVCYKVNDQCKKWDKISGACTECYPGFQIYRYNCVAAKVQIIFQEEKEEKEEKEEQGGKKQITEGLSRRQSSKQFSSSSSK